MLVAKKSTKLPTRVVRVANIVFQKILETSKCLMFALPQAIGLLNRSRSQLSRGTFPFLSGVTDFLCKIESTFFNSKVIVGGFVMGCAKIFGFKHI